MALKGILFDKDGTLIDFDATFGPATGSVVLALADGDEAKAAALCEAALFDPATLTVDPESFLLAGSIADIAAGWLVPAGRVEFQGFIAEIDTLYRRFSLQSLAPFPFTFTALERLKEQGFKLGIATNDSEQAAREHAGKAGWNALFDHIFGFDSGHGAKPGPGMVTAFAEAIHAAPAHVMMVGDTLHDLQAGRAAGAKTAAVTSGRWGHKHLAPHADHVLAHIGELPDFVSKLESRS